MEHIKSTTVARIYKLLEPMLSNEEKPSFDEVVDAIDIGLTEWKLAIEIELRRKITTWEEKMEDGDTTLYSLGLRHAIDLVTNFNPTENNLNEEKETNEIG